MPEGEKPFGLPEEDEKMLAGLTDEIRPEEAVKWPEQDFAKMNPESRKRLCQQLIANYLERCDDQIAVIGKFKDDSEKNRLLSYWQKIREELKAGRPEELLKVIEARIDGQIGQLTKINRQIAALSDNNFERNNLSKQKEMIVDRLENLLRDERNLFFIDNFYAPDKKPEVSHDSSQETIKELIDFCQKIIQEISENGDVSDVAKENDWPKIKADLEKGDVNSLYGALCYWSAALTHEKKQLMYNITNPPKNMTEAEKEATAEMVRTFQKRLKRQGEIEAIIVKIEALKNYGDNGSVRSNEKRRAGAQADEAMLQAISEKETGQRTKKEKKLTEAEKQELFYKILDFCDEQIGVYKQRQRPEDERRWLQAKIEYENGNEKPLKETIDFFIDQKSAEFDKAEIKDDRRKCQEIGEQLSRLVDFQNKLEQLMKSKN